MFYPSSPRWSPTASPSGVGGGIYGVDQDTLRQQMAVFLLKAKHGLCYVPPPCTTQVFDDVPCSLVFAPWINELVAEGFTGGCGSGNTYCPASPVLRQQMAVLLLRTLLGTGYTPPACTDETFTDVPCSSNFAPWIYDLVARGITAGCGGGLYCPTSTANRGQMATFISRRRSGSSNPRPPWAVALCRSGQALGRSGAFCPPRWPDGVCRTLACTSTSYLRP